MPVLYVGNSLHDESAAQPLHRSCRKKELPMKHIDLGRAGVIAMTFFVFASIAAQPPERDAAGSAAKSKSSLSNEADAKRGSDRDELTVCKEKAQGLAGPQRGRFMTECLAQN